FRDGKGPPSTVTATGYHSSPGSGSQAPFFKRSACFCLLFSHFLNSRSAKHTELRILNVTFGSSERQIQIGLPHWLQVSSCKIWYASRSMKSYGVQGSVGCSWKIMADGRMPAAIAALIFVMTWVLGGHVSAVTKTRVNRLVEVGVGERQAPQEVDQTVPLGSRQGLVESAHLVVGELVIVHVALVVLDG